MAELTDLYGRTIVQLVGAIERAQGTFKITASYSGNEELGKKIGRARRHIEIDDRQLQLLRKGIDPKTLGVYFEREDAQGNLVTGFDPPMSAAARQKLHADILRLGKR